MNTNDFALNFTLDFFYSYKCVNQHNSPPLHLLAFVLYSPNPIPDSNKIFPIVEFVTGCHGAAFSFLSTFLLLFQVLRSNDVLERMYDFRNTDNLP